MSNTTFDPEFLSQLTFEPLNKSIIEAYPTIPTKGMLPDSFVWTGLFQSFIKTGFEVVDRTSKNRPMVRYYETSSNSTSERY